MAPLIADTGDFGKVYAGSFSDMPLVLTNSGKCALTVTVMASSSPAFMVPKVLSYPLRIMSGDCLPVPIRFAPTSIGDMAATIEISSSDLAGPRTITVSGFAPAGKLAVTGSTTFGGVTARCCADRKVAICNVGDCGLDVSSVRFKCNSRHSKLVHNPFPATLHTGSCLKVMVRYKATEKCPRAGELIIESHDPTTPVKTLDLLAYTIWNPCGCKECCDEGRRGTCRKIHADPCCRQRYPCCDDDDYDYDYDYDCDD